MSNNDAQTIKRLTPGEVYFVSPLAAATWGRDIRGRSGGFLSDDCLHSRCLWVSHLWKEQITNSSVPQVLSADFESACGTDLLSIDLGYEVPVW